MTQLMKHLHLNTKGRDFVVGDLHGCYELLQDAMEKVYFDTQRDRIIAVGDIIDRGEESEKCLNLIYEPYFYSVLGNHERMMIDSVIYHDAGSYQCWMQNGGLWALDYVATQEDWQFEFVDLVRDARSHMPLTYTVETKKGLVGIVHAQPPQIWNEALIKFHQWDCLWSRALWDSGKIITVKDIDHIYVGHTPMMQGIVTMGNITYTDTGCNWTGKLDLIQI